MVSAEVGPTICSRIQPLVWRGSRDLHPSILTGLCRELECLPTDILRAV